MKLTDLHIACMAGDCEKVKDILDNCDYTMLKEVILKEDEKKATAFHYAANYCRTDVVRNLLEKVKGDNDLLRELMLKQDGAAFYRNNVNMTAFHYACMAKASRLVQVIIDTIKEDRNLLKDLILKKNKHKRTAFDIACENGAIEVVNVTLEAVIEHGDLLKELVLREGLKGTSLNYACMGGHYAVVKALLHAVEKDERLVRDLLFKPVRDQHALVATVLHHACAKGAPEIVEALLDVLKTDRNTLKDLILKGDHKEATMLHYACKQSATEVVGVLLTTIKDDTNLVKDLITKEDQKGATALHYACKSGAAEVVKIMLDAVKGDKDTLKELILKQDGKNMPFNHNLTSLQYACIFKATEIVKVLVHTIKGDIQLLQELILKEDQNKRTPFYNACRHGATDVVNVLLDTIKDHKDLMRDVVLKEELDIGTALNYACDKGYIKIAKAILSAAKRDRKLLGKLMLTTDQFGNTAFKTVAKKRHFEVITAMFTEFHLHSRKTMEFLNDATLNNVCELGAANAVLNMLYVAEQCDESLDVIRQYLSKKDNDERTLLHIACGRGDKELIVPILSHIQNIGAKEHTALVGLNVICAQDSTGQTALHETCRLQNPDTLQGLLDTSMKLKIMKIKTSDGNCTEKLLCAINHQGRTAFYEAFENGDFTKVKVLLQYATMAKCLEKLLLCRTKNGQTIFHRALQHSYSHMRCLDTIVNHLTHANTQVNIQLFQAKDCQGETLFHYLPTALEEIISILMKLDKDGTCLLSFLLEQDENKQTVLHRTCIDGNTAMLQAIAHCIKCLKPEGGEHPWNKSKFIQFLSAQDQEGKTPLYYCCMQGSNKNLKTLLDIARMCDGCFESMIRKKDNSGKTCLYFLQKADDDLLETLMEEITTHDKPGNPNEQRVSSSTFIPSNMDQNQSDIPLSILKQESSHLPMDSISFNGLLTHNLLTDKDDDGKTPLWYAGERQKAKCVEFLTPFYKVLKENILKQNPDSDLKLDSKDGRETLIEKTSPSDYILFETPSQASSYKGKAEISLLTVFGKLNCLDMIRHDYTQCYLMKCWRSYGRYFFYINFFLYLTLVALLTLFVISHQENPSSHDNSYSIERSLIMNVTNTSGSHISKSTEFSYKLEMISTLSTAHAISVVILAISVILLIWEGLQFAAKRMDYWTSLENWADIVISIGSVVLTIGCWINGYRAWNHVQWTALVILAWFKVAWLMTKIPKYTSRLLELTGRKFLMLFKVMENVMKFLPVLILFTGTFSFGFVAVHRG